MSDNKRFFNKNGYTLAEVLMILGMIGIIAALVMPSIISSVPKNYEALNKKTAYVLERTVSDIVNNEEYYERKDIITGEEGQQQIHYQHGLQNTYPVNIDGQIFGSDDSSSDEAKQKFCRIFASKFQLKEGTSVNCSDNASFDGTPTFTSIDNIEWIVPVSNFADNQNKTIEYKLSGEIDDHKCVYTLTPGGKLYKNQATSDDFE